MFCLLFFFFVCGVLVCMCLFWLVRVGCCCVVGCYGVLCLLFILCFVWGSGLCLVVYVCCLFVCVFVCLVVCLFVYASI